VAQRNDVEVRAFEPRDERAVLDLLQAAFTVWPAEIESITPAEFFRWKHASSPWGRSSLFVVKTDGKVVAFAGYMPWRFTARRAVITAARGVDFAVHPDYRRRGASLAFHAAANALPGIALIWSNPNEASGGGALKSGRRRIDSVPRYVRPRRGPVRLLAGATARSTRSLERLEIDAISAHDALRDDAYLDRLLEESGASEERLATLKDRHYLRWRYRLEEYRAVRTSGPGSRPGVAIFRPRRRRGALWALDVCELLVGQGDVRGARALLRQLASASDADLISCGFRSRGAAARHGFVRAGGATLMAYPLRADLDPDPTRSECWSLSRGDLELL
jgi:hypothetical protein